MQQVARPFLADVKEGAGSIPTHAITGLGPGLSSSLCEAQAVSHCRPDYRPPGFLGSAKNNSPPWDKGMMHMADLSVRHRRSCYIEQLREAEKRYICPKGW